MSETEEKWSPPHSFIHTLLRDDPDATLDHQQNDSELYTAIPPEIRSNIFSFTLLAYDDKTHEYRTDSYHSRPGYRFRKRITTALLSTCKSIYRETHKLPVKLNEHVLWGQRGPRGNDDDDAFVYFKRMTAEQLECVTRVHFFTQLFWLDGTFPSNCLAPGMQHLTYLKITIRQSDWWWWEENQKLRMRGKRWANRLDELENLKVMDMELEVIERDKGQLDDIAKAMSAWTFPAYGGRVLKVDNQLPSRWMVERWNGTSVYAQQGVGTGTADYTPTIRYDHGMESWQYVPRPTAWSRLKVTLARRPSPLTYYVVTLRWTVV